MNVDTEALLALPAAEKLQIIELLWDNLGDLPTEIPLPEWADREATRRRDEMIADSNLGLDHGQVWENINNRNG